MLLTHLSSISILMPKSDQLNQQKQPIKGRVGLDLPEKNSGIHNNLLPL